MMTFDVAVGNSMSSTCRKVFDVIEKGDANKLKDILENGIRTFSGIEPVNASMLRDPKDGFTGLFVACACGHEKCVEILLEYDPESIKNKTYEYGCTALHFAARSHSLKVVKMLCEKDSSLIHCKNTKGDTPIFWGCIGGNAKIVKYLMSCGAETGTASENGVTTLMCSLMTQDEETNSDERRSKIVRHLLLKSPNLVNLQDHDGTTALHLAAGFCLPKCLQVLLSHGADLKIRDNSDKTALSLLAALRQSPQELEGDETKSNMCIEILENEWNRLEQESAKQILELFGIEKEEEEKRSSKKKRKKKKRKKKNKKKSNVSKYDDDDKSKCKTQNVESVLVCDGCYDPEASDYVGIQGARMKCDVCEDFDFCEDCFKKSLTRKNDMTSSSHGPGHTFTRIEVSSEKKTPLVEKICEAKNEETEEEEEMEEEEVSKETKENISHDLPLVSRIEENVLDGEWITVSKQKKKMQKEKEEKTKIKKSTAKKNQQVSSPKEEEKIRYAKGPDNSTQGFERKVTVSPKPSKEKYRTPMRRYGYFTSPNLFFRGSSIFRETHDINNRRISSRTPQRPYPVSFNHNQSTLQHPQSRSLRTMMVSSYPRTSQWNLDLRPEHLLSRNLSELSFAQLDALEQIHADSIRRIQQARLELARANERQLVASQFQIARRGGV